MSSDPSSSTRNEAVQQYSATKAPTHHAQSLDWKHHDHGTISTVKNTMNNIALDGSEASTAPAKFTQAADDDDSGFLSIIMGLQMEGSVKAVLEQDDLKTAAGTSLNPEASYSALTDGIYSSLNLDETSEGGNLASLYSGNEFSEENETTNDIDLNESGQSKVPTRLRQIKGRLGRETGKPLLSVRVPAPVQNCSCSPFLLVRDNDGNMIELDSERVSLDFRWYRSKKFRKCANPKCSNEPLSSSSRLQCFSALLRGTPSEFTYFCGTQCLRQCWPVEAAAVYAACVDLGEADCDFNVLSLAVALAGTAVKQPSLNDQMDNKLLAYDMTEKSRQLGSVDNDEDQKLNKSLKYAEELCSKAHDASIEPVVKDESGEEWVLVSTSKEYVPNFDDVWHDLKIFVKATLDAEHVVHESSNAQYALPYPPLATNRQFIWASSLREVATKATANALRKTFQTTKGNKGNADTDFFKVLTETSEYRKLLAGFKPFFGNSQGKFTVSLPPLLKPLLRFRAPPKPQDDTIRVLSYNALAEIYATQNVYPYCQTWALQWSYRWRRLLHEIRCLDADIVCLQEAQADHFESDVLPAMEELGYKGLYKQKTREPMGAPGKVDGCAMFFKARRFRLKEKYVIEYNEAAMAVGRAETESANSLPNSHANDRKLRINAIRKALQRLLRDNVAQICLLEMFADANCRPFPGKTTLPVVVANTHLFWDPGYSDVKLWQTNVLTNQLNKFLRQQRETFRKHHSSSKTRTKLNDVPLILCGDFNSEPHSAVHRYLGQNSGYHLSQDGNLLASVRSQDLPTDPSGILPSPELLSHDIPLVSSYAAVNGDEPSYTNVTKDYTGCIDYVWFSADVLEAAGVLQMPSLSELMSYSGSPLPNSQWPSDHLCLCADFIPAAASAAKITPTQLSHLYTPHSSLRRTPVQQKTHDFSVYAPESDVQSVFANVAIDDTGESEMLQETEAVAMSSDGSRRVALHNTTEMPRNSSSTASEPNDSPRKSRGASPSVDNRRSPIQSNRTTSVSSLAQQVQSRLRMQSKTSDDQSKSSRSGTGPKLEPRGMNSRRPPDVK